MKSQETLGKCMDMKIVENRKNGFRYKNLSKLIIHEI